MSELLVKIVTLQGIFLEEEASMVTFPAWDGEVGIMPAHIPFIFELADGLVRFYKESEVIKEVKIQGGFARIYEDAVSIVTNHAADNVI